MAAKKPAVKRSVRIRACGPDQPYMDTGCDETWAINNAGDVYGFDPDLIVAMDDLDRDFRMPQHKKYVRSIVRAGCPVYSARADTRWPAVAPYPLKETLVKLGLGLADWNLFDNTLNYTFALALARGFSRIEWYGVLWVRPYDHIELKVAMHRWRLKGYTTAPDWFAYHDKGICYSRHPLEPGADAFHWWCGFAKARGVDLKFPYGTSVLNRDREPHWYGYQEQPKL